jgi:photosystem II stability/assembly factor-like uncharacterized protein
MCATCDHSTLLVNVHVGGIPRSTDAGRTWKPTIDVESDVHHVCAHPTRPELVAAATAVRLAVSKDGGATWTAEQEGLHASHCSAVAFVGDDVLVSASTDPFSKEGVVYRRPVEGEGPLHVTVGGGHVYLSRDRGATWKRIAEHLPFPSGVLFC